MSDLPPGYRWATEQEVEQWKIDPASLPMSAVVRLTPEGANVAFTVDHLAVPNVAKP